MYAIGLRHTRDAFGAACIHGLARAGARTGTPGRTGRRRSERFGHRSGSRTGTDVALRGSGTGA